MYYHPQTNSYITEGQPFTIDDVQHPANWLNLASADDKAALGLVEVTTVGTREDDRYYWVSETLEGAVRTIVNTPKAPEMIAALHKAVVDAKLVVVRDLRELTINRLNGIADRLARKGDAQIRATADGVVDALLEITKGLPIDPAQVDMAVMLRYAAIVEPLKTNNSALLKAFAEMDT